MRDGWQYNSVAEICETVSVGIVIRPAQYYVSHAKGVRAFRSTNVGEGKVLDRDWVYISIEGSRGKQEIGPQGGRCASGSLWRSRHCLCRTARVRRFQLH